jgi:DNA topoisomerase-3
LPGLARGGTTVVISPLIALMDDQVLKLKERGFAVECIHSGRDRETSRRVCSDYLGGKLQFLFIAPERLRVAGFPEMLAKGSWHVFRMRTESGLEPATGFG